MDVVLWVWTMAMADYSRVDVVEMGYLMLETPTFLFH